MAVLGADVHAVQPGVLLLGCMQGHSPAISKQGSIDSCCVGGECLGP